MAKCPAHQIDIVCDWYRPYTLSVCFAHAFFWLKPARYCADVYGYDDDDELPRGGRELAAEYATQLRESKYPAPQILTVCA